MKYIPTCTSTNYLCAKLAPVARAANANMCTDSGMRNLQSGQMFVYYKNIAYKPYTDIYYKVDSDMTICLT
jgi:hypothetical protein